jgi:hypothetical protein
MSTHRATIRVINPNSNELVTRSIDAALDPRKEKAVGNDAVLTDLALDLGAIESQMAIIRSTALMRRVVEKERLYFDPEFGSGLPSAGKDGGMRVRFTLDPMHCCVSNIFQKRFPCPTRGRGAHRA